MSLEDAHRWAAKHAGLDATGPFSATQVSEDSQGGLAASRSYSLALAPQLLHARSELLTQLVSSKAFRQIEFLAVGSFFIFQPASEASTPPKLSRIPSTREDVFSNSVIPARAKRSLMKFLRFVLEYDSEPQLELWKPRESRPLTEFLETEFKLDADSQSYIVTLTLSADGAIPVGSGLAAVNRHLVSTGVFGAGFAAVYPRWGGLSEVAQVGCRAAAVGGATYMLGVGVSGVQRTLSDGEDQVEVSLTNGVAVTAKRLIRSSSHAYNGPLVSRLAAIVNAPLASLFKVVVEGAPTPCAAVVAFPVGSIMGEDGTPSRCPIYALAHSSDAGECPTGQCTLYLSTPASSESKALLNTAITSLLAAASGPEPAKCIWQLYYEQASGTGSFTTAGENIGVFDWLTSDLSFNDSLLEPVRDAWLFVTGRDDIDNYMKFEDREGVTDDDVFDS